MMFSVITPCFNSTKTLMRTYESLVALECRDFEWVLVDDASTDGGVTAEMIMEVARIAPFPVKAVFLTENSYGARSAYEGALVSEGRYICILDHDDCLLPSALNIVSDVIAARGNDHRIAGVAGRCLSLSKEIIGQGIDISSEGTEGELRFRRSFHGELIQFTKRELVIRYFSRMKPGYTNGYIWAMISSDYRWVYINHALRIYDTECPTSFTNSGKKKITFPAARAEAIEASFISFSGYYSYSILYSLKMIGSAIRYKFHAGAGLRWSLGHSKLGVFLYCLAFPLGYAKFFIDRFSQWVDSNEN